MAHAPERARYRLECPRCAGDMTALDGAAALECPHCRERYFLGADGNVGWLLPPRLHPGEALDAAKRWLREEGHRVTRMDEPRGVLVPFYWIRGLLFLWERRRAEGTAPPETGGTMRAAGLTRSLAGVLGPELFEGPAASSSRGGDEGWENRGSVRAYAGAIPGHPLGRLWRGLATRFAVRPLDLLDPDRLPAGFELLAPSLSAADAETEAATWVERRRRASGMGTHDRRASGELQRRLNLVAAPLILVPFAFREEEDGAVVVDGLTGTPLGLVSGEDAAAGEEEAPAAVFARFSGPSLLPLECSECGWELSLRERDRLHPCPGCGRCWELVGQRRRRVRQWFLDARPGPEGRWLPFWVFGTEGSAAGAGAGAGATGEDHPPARPLFVPAYAGRHLEDQMLLAATLTRTPPRGNWLPELEEVPGGAEVGSREAEGWRFAVEGALARSSQAEFRKFLTERGAPQSAEKAEESVREAPAGLVWLAFRREGADLVETVTGAKVRATGAVPWENRKAA